MNGPDRPRLLPLWLAAGILLAGCLGPPGEDDPSLRDDTPTTSRSPSTGRSTTSCSGSRSRP